MGGGGEVRRPPHLILLTAVCPLLRLGYVGITTSTHLYNESTSITILSHPYHNMNEVWVAMISKSTNESLCCFLKLTKFGKLILIRFAIIAEISTPRFTYLLTLQFCCLNNNTMTVLKYHVTSLQLITLSQGKKRTVGKSAGKRFCLSNNTDTAKLYDVNCLLFSLF